MPRVVDIDDIKTRGMSISFYIDIVHERSIGKNNRE